MVGNKKNPGYADGNPSETKELVVDCISHSLDDLRYVKSKLSNDNKSSRWYMNVTNLWHPQWELFFLAIVVENPYQITSPFEENLFTWINEPHT